MKCVSDHVIYEIIGFKASNKEGKRRKREGNNRSREVAERVTIAPKIEGIRPSKISAKSGAN